MFVGFSALQFMNITNIYQITPDFKKKPRMCSPRSLIKDDRCQGWRDSSEVQNPCNGAEFSSQHLHGCSQLSVTLASGDLMPSFGSMGTDYAYSVHIYILANTHTHKIQISGSLKNRFYVLPSREITPHQTGLCIETRTKQKNMLTI